MPEELSTTYQVKGNEFLFSFSKKEIDEVDLVRISSTQFNLIKDHRSVTAKIIDADRSCKKLKVEIDGDVFTVEIKDELDTVLEQMGFGASSNKAIREIKAPMP